VRPEVIRRGLLWLPLAAFAVVALLVALELHKPADRQVRSTQIDQPVPDLVLPALLPGKPGLDPRAAATGQPRLINVFASWCVPCIAEMPQLMQLKRAGVRIDAVAVRDTAPAIQGFLARYGDPFTAVGDDAQSRFQLSLGSSGVPETFYVDGKGRIRRQHVGMIAAADVPEVLQTLASLR
jgi:cytochrome c biogenesis protein CcmG/thiol:disulfide interchange protein DsbE